MTDAERYAIILRKVRVDDQDLWRATVRELPDVAEFAETREEVLDLALDTIESLQASAAEDGRPFPEPIEDEEEYSGRVTLRMSKSLHRVAALRADAEGVSLNSFIAECVAERVGHSAAVQEIGSWSTATGLFRYEELIPVMSATFELGVASLTVPHYEEAALYNVEPAMVGSGGLVAAKGRAVRHATTRLRRVS